ncbi:DUF1365 domain-containing protein [Azoarcus sp. KH32C]|uniref:DUF1365 domain-containing protein n=1 Tax=Azoarcus sp. KH32C TaxID=748247 RepID=UPI0002385D48|nr:DUF1365 domain-containing protein [Azoarcus sp. KH32C]BAL27529.1 hypothetical protein AZKH_p0646 [Azoarcus sp. KH32C]
MSALASFRPQLFFGHVMHRRLRPKVNDFAYPVFYVQLPLRDLASANCGVFSVDRANLLSFRSEDHGPRDGSPLLPWICGLLREHGLPDDGEIVLQTFPRVFGYVFNPVSFWYCHARDGRLVAILVEVNNTFGGTYGYVLHRQGQPLADGEELHAEKVLHVSPFNEVRGGYRFRFHLERAVQVARIDYDDAEGELLRTSISGSPRPWSPASLLSALLRMPFLTLGVIARIHWQALRLWLKGVPFHGAHAIAPAAEPLGKSTK